MGHSIGCQTILRYLEKQSVPKIGGVLLVAPWLDLLPEAIEDIDSYETAKPWMTTPIDFKKIKSKTNTITCIFSSDDYFVSLSEKNKFSRTSKKLLPDNAIFLTDYASEIFISNQNTLILSKKPKIQISLIN